jgi:hypothetical protein
MKRIIDGKRYNTDTATEIADVSPSGFYRGDFRYEDTKLYRTPKGRWFLSGEGGPMSRWAQSAGLNSYCGGAGLHVLDDDEARALLEQHGETEAIETYFGAVVQDA